MVFPRTTPPHYSSIRTVTRLIPTQIAPPCQTQSRRANLNQNNLWSWHRPKMILSRSSISPNVTVSLFYLPNCAIIARLKHWCLGTHEGYPTYVAIKVRALRLVLVLAASLAIVQCSPTQGTVFDVSGKDAYAPGKSYHGTLHVLQWCVQ
jgi:hypothetical protein